MALTFAGSPRVSGFAFSSSPVLPVAAAPPPAPAAPLLPDLSLTGQTWGWPIPLTAGKRTIPGRPLWRRVRQATVDGVASYFFDVAVSFGFRAEIMAGLAPDSFNFHRLLANGVVIKDWTTNGVAPGVTVTAYDGTQTAADPFLVSVDGADDVQAFIFHIYCVVENLPLKQFTNLAPDAWAVEVFDVIEQVEVHLFDNSAGVLGSDSGVNEAVSNMVVDFGRDTIWQASDSAAGIVLKQWSIAARDSVAVHPAAPWGALTPTSYNAQEQLYPLRAAGHLLFTHLPAGIASKAPLWAVDPASHAITASLAATFLQPQFSLATNQATPPGGALTDVVLGVTGDATALNEMTALAYDGSTLTTLGVLSGIDFFSMPSVISGRSNGASAEFWAWDEQADGSTYSLYKITVTLTGAGAGAITSALFGVLGGDGYELQFSSKGGIPLADGGFIAWGDSTGDSGAVFARLAADASVLWTTATPGRFLQLYLHGNPSGGNGSLVGDTFILAGFNAGRLVAWKVRVSDGAVTAFDLDDLWPYGDVSFPLESWQFDAPNSRIIGTSWLLGQEGFMYEIILGGTAGTTDGITLARVYQLLGALTRGVTVNVALDASITDTVGSLFIVEQGSLTQFANQIGRACNCDVRENNQGLQVVRNVDGETFNISLELTEADLIRDKGQSALTYSRAGDDQLPAEMRLQFIANEATFKYTEQRARRDFGPLPTTRNTAVAAIRIPLGMGVNKAQTYVSEALYRETELRAQAVYRLAWKDALRVQPGDVHQITLGDDVALFKVIRADLKPDRTLAVTAMRLHTAQVYDGLAFAGAGLASFSATGG